jgi:hypothetical protein
MVKRDSPYPWQVRAKRCYESLNLMKKGSWYLVFSLSMAIIIHIPSNLNIIPIFAALIGIVGSIYQIRWCKTVYLPTFREVSLTEPLAEIENRVLFKKDNKLLHNLSWQLFLPNGIALILSGIILLPWINILFKQLVK